jgi:hypothetical protein
VKWIGCLLLAACATNEPRVLCSESVDHAPHRPGMTSLAQDFADARADHRVVFLHGHKPGEMMSVATIDDVIALARMNHLPMLRYDEVASATEGGVAFAIDDNAIDDWFALRDLFNRTGTHVTFFVSRWADQAPAEIDKLMTLAGDGHELEPHTVNHLHPIDYVEEHGLSAWLADEVDPSIQIMRDHGLEPQFFAYPFGERDADLDRAMLERIGAVRATGHYCER